LTNDGNDRTLATKGSRITIDIQGVLMFKRLSLIAGAVAAAALMVAPVGSAAKPTDPGQGGRCIAAGVGTLVDAGLITQAAEGTLDYAAFGTNGAGLVRLALPVGSFIPLNQVISLHRTNPELFAWCDSV